jgi:4'-phosphopantetheinyl transferase
VAEQADPDPLPDGTADVWWARRKDASDRLAVVLDETERRRWTAYRRPEDRERFLVGCALAKAALARYTGRSPADVRFDRSCAACGEPHGKPVIAGGGPGHSVAHSGDLIAVAVARAPVGVDVEQAEGRPHLLGGDGDPEALGRLVLSGPEQAALASVPAGGRARAFLVAWTRKEAVTKATGDGVRATFSEVVVAAAAGPPRVTSWPYPRSPRDVSLRDLATDAGYVAALAVIGRCEAVRARDGSALLAELSHGRVV